MAALIISIISIIISGILMIIQIVVSQKNNKQNLESNLIKEMYGEYLIVQIPQGREYIHFDGVKISGVDKLMDAISGIRRSSLYFKAVDRIYYDSVRKKCQEFEDYLNCTTKEYTSVEFGEFINGVDENIAEIYKIVGKKYSG